jgi:hypothetical protein
MISLLPGEELSILSVGQIESKLDTDESINSKYIKGDVRIVTEQGRTQLRSVVSLIDDKIYNLNPEFQRRRRWDDVKKSKLIESFIMNVPIPPIFLYEDRFSHYEVMDGLQRLTAIHDFYGGRLRLQGLTEWPELNGRTYGELPEQVKLGVDRRYLSSIVLLQETAKSDEEAKRLKQLVFERINSGGVLLEAQESRNAIYNGPLNQLCIRLARDSYLCKMWNIPEQTEDEINDSSEISNKLINNEIYKKMADVELVLRFFANRQRIQQQKKETLKEYLDRFLNYGNNNLSPDTLFSYEDIFKQTTKLVFEILGKEAFWSLRQINYSKKESKWSWLERPTTLIYDPLMFVFSEYLDKAEQIITHKEVLKKGLEEFYKANYKKFEGRKTDVSLVGERIELFEKFLAETLSQ